MKDLVPLLKEQLDQGKTVTFIPQGKSMEPMLKGGKDVVMLKKPRGRLHLFDVALYYRKETDRYVVHRVVGFKSDGSYIMCGDNNFQKEYNIADEDIIGVVTGFYRKGNMKSVDTLSYRFYCNFWYYFRPIRLIGIKLFSGLKNHSKGYKK